MLESLTLHHFQKHERYTLDLNHPIVTLVGPSDAGKSSVIRALRWLLLNQPPKGRFITFGEDACKVSATFADGKRLTRKRTKEGNSYHFGGTTYTAFGQNVPDAIAAYLRVDDLNFAGQFEPSFWFLDSPGKVSRELNAIVNLEVIDSTLSAVASEMRKARSCVDVSTERLDAAKAKKDTLGWVEALNEHLESLEGKQEALREQQKRISLLEQLLEEIQELNKRQSVRIPSTSKLKELLEKWQETKRCRERLEELLEEVNNLEGKRQKLTEEWQRVRSELKEAVGDQCPLCQQPISKKNLTAFDRRVL